MRPSVLALVALAAVQACLPEPEPTRTDHAALAEEVKEAITTDALMTYSAAITRHVRPSGSPGENAAIDTVVAVLEAAGVPVTVHELDAYASDPVAAAVTIPGTDFAPPAITMSYSASSAGTVGEVVDMGALRDLPRLEVGTGERLVIEGEDFGADLPDLSGRVAIVDGQPRNVPTIVLERLGAAAVVFVNPEERLNELIVTSTWGSPSLMNHHRLPRVPVAQITRSAGEELRARMAAGPLELRVETEVATGWKPMRLAVATIALALAFHDVRDRLRHGLMVAWWPGHSNARYAGPRPRAQPTHRGDRRCHLRQHLGHPAGGYRRHARGARRASGVPAATGGGAGAGEPAVTGSYPPPRWIRPASSGKWLR